MARAASKCVDAAGARLEECKIRFNEAEGQHQFSPNYPDEFRRFSIAVEDLRLAEQASEYLAKMMPTGS